MEKFRFKKATQPKAEPKQSPKPGRARINKLWQNRVPGHNESLNVSNALINSMGEGVIMIDEYGYINHVNQAALDTLGYERQELEGKWFQDALPSIDKEGHPIPAEERLMSRAFATGEPVSDIVSYYRKDGSRLPIYNTSSPFIVGGKPRGGIVVFHDVSKEIQIERAKDEFVSLASHQLRTPLTSIKFFAELLQDPYYGKLTKKQLGYLEKILFSTERMISLVSELLDISRLNLGKLEIKTEPTIINSLLQNQVTQVMPIAVKNGVKLSFSSKVAKGELVPLDRTLISQVVHNLLTNAIRYCSDSDPGRVRLSFGKTTKNYKIEVSDNGIGIPSDASSQIYERFYRADNAKHTQVEGTGLGLYLVKFIIESSGGTIQHSSTLNKGTTFTIRLPLSGMKASE